jgi:hypothetical protein
MLDPFCQICEEGATTGREDRFARGDQDVSAPVYPNGAKSSPEFRQDLFVSIRLGLPFLRIPHREGSVSLRSVPNFKTGPIDHSGTPPNRARS